MEHLQATWTSPFPGLDNPSCPRLAGGQGELQLLLAHGDVGAESGGHASVLSQHAVRMWAAEHPEPEAGKLPGVDSNEHQSALIHPGERPLAGNCIFLQGLLRSFPRSLYPHVLNRTILSQCNRQWGNGET